MALDSSVTLKVHVLFEHLLPGLANLGCQGMGLISEHAGESLHHKFANNYWSKYKINMISNPQYTTNWLSLDQSTYDQLTVSSLNTSKTPVKSRKFL